MLSISKKWVDIAEWADILILQTEGWEVALIEPDSVLLIREL